MKVFNKKPHPVVSGNKQRRVPTFAASLRTAAKPIDEPLEQRRTLLTTKQQSEWRKNQSDGKKKIAIGKTFGVTEKELAKKPVLEEITSRSPSKTNYPHAIFSIEKVDSFPLSYGVDTESPFSAENKDADKFARVENEDDEAGAEKLENLISNLEYELKKLQDDFNLNLKQSNKEDDDTSGEYADLFSRSPPDERILKQYFPSTYKTTEEIFTKSASQVPIPTPSYNDILDDVKRRMNTLNDNIHWVESFKRTHELNNILDSYRVDPSIVTLKLEIKQLVDDCISSLEPEVKDTVRKQLEDENKKSLFEDKALTKSKQVTKLSRKDTFQRTTQRNKENKSIPSKQNLKSSSESKFSRQPSLPRKNCEKNEEKDDSFEKVPPLWDESSHSYVYGNLLKLGKRFSDLNPYPHLRNPLPSKPTPWPPKSPAKKNPIKQISSVSAKQKVTRLNRPKSAIQTKKSKEDESILQAKLMKVQYRRTEVDKPIQQVEGAKKYIANKIGKDEQIKNVRKRLDFSETKQNSEVESNIEETKKRKLIFSPIKKQVRFKAIPRPIPIPRWSDGSPVKEIEDDLEDLKIEELKLQNQKSHSGAEAKLIIDISTNNGTINEWKNPVLINMACNNHVKPTRELNKPHVWGKDIGAAGDQPGDENVDKPENEHKQVIHTGGGDAEFVFNKVDDLQNKAPLNNSAGSSNFGDGKSVSDNKKTFNEDKTRADDDGSRVEVNNESGELEISEMSSSSIANEEETKNSIEEVEEEISTNTNTNSMVYSEVEKQINSELPLDELIESDKVEIADIVILPGYSPPSTASQKLESQPHKHYKHAKHKVPSDFPYGTPQWQSSKEILMKTAQDWVEKELVARTLSLRLSQNDKHNERKVVSDSNLDENREMSMDKELLQSLVEEILKEKTVTLLENSRKEKENISDADEYSLSPENQKEIIEEEMLETPQPTPSPSPAQSYSEVFEKSEDGDEIISTPPSSVLGDSKKERLSGGGKNYKDVESVQPPFAAYTDEIATPNSSSSPSQHSDSEQVADLLSPNQTSTDLEPFPLHRVPEEPQIFVDEATQTEAMETEIPASHPEIPPLPIPSSIYPPEKLSVTAEKATSTPPSPDATTSTTSPMASSLSEGEWINLKPWQTITPFFRYANQLPTNNVVALDNSLHDLEDLEQDPTSEGEIRFPQFSAWRSSFVAAAIASGFQTDKALQFSISNINITEPGPSTQPSMFFNRPESPGELPAQVSEVFSMPPSLSTTSVGVESENENKLENLERRFSTCSVQAEANPSNQESPPNRIPIQHITVEDNTSIPNEDEILLNALQNIFLPAEPGLVLPVTQSLDPVLRRQYLERLVSEGEIRASFPLSPNRASNPDHLRSWGRSLVNAMIKKTISAPGLNAHRKADDNKSIPIQRLSTIIASRNTSRSSQTQTDFPLSGEVKTPALEDPKTNFRETEVSSVPSTSNAPMVFFKEFPFEPQELNVGTIPKVKARKSSIKISHSKLQPDIHKVLSSTSQLDANTSTSIPTLVPASNCEFLIKRNPSISIRPSPAMLPEDFQGHLQGLHPVISKNSAIDIGQDLFKDSSGTIMMGSLGTIDEESNEALIGVHKRVVKGVHSSDSEGECIEGNFTIGKTVETPKKVIDRSLSHSADLSEGEVPPRETRSHQ